MYKVRHKIVESSISLLVVKSSTNFQYIWHLFILIQRRWKMYHIIMHFIVVHNYTNKTSNNDHNRWGVKEKPMFIHLYCFITKRVIIKPF